MKYKYQHYHQQPRQLSSEPVERQHQWLKERGAVTKDVEMEPKMDNMLGMTPMANSSYEVVIVEPCSFAQIPQVIQQVLQERKAVMVLNLKMMDPQEAQRVVDFVVGANYAVDGYQQRVDDGIFLFTPKCVQITTAKDVVQAAPPPQEGNLSRTIATAA